MLGKTNAQKTDTCPDAHTLLLLNKADVRDHSKYQHGLFFSNQEPYADYTVMRDGRPGIHFDSHYIGVRKTDFINSDHPWTIETWYYGFGSRDSALAWIVVSGSYYGLLWGYNSNARYMYLSNNGSSWNLFGQTECTSGGATYNTWQHRALVWTGTEFLNFTDGVLFNTIAISSSWTFGGNFHIGYYSGNLLNGCIQDYRISDVARYTSNFTPPTRFL